MTGRDDDRDEPLGTAPMDTPVTPEERSRADYSHARFMALQSRPVSVEAQAVVAAVTGRLGSWERETAARRRQRLDKMLDQYRRAVGLVIGDLALAADKDVDRWSFRPIGRGEFTGEFVSYRQFTSIFAGLKALGLVEALPGFYDRQEGWVQGRSTRLRASPSLIDLFRGNGIGPGGTRKHFLTELPPKPLVLKASSTRKGHLKRKGEDMKFKHNDRSRQLLADVRELNEFIDRHELLGGTHRGYRRIFNQGDHPAFNWNKGGRLYSQGDDSYQRIKQGDRLKMTIGGEPVVEIDVRTSYLTILHARCGVPADTSGDLYDVPGLDREVVKKWVTMTLGHDKFHTRWPSDTVKDAKKDGIDLSKDFPLKNVQRRVTESLPILSVWPRREADCFDLMFLESEAVVNTMLRLKREHSVVCLSVHDSIIVPRKHLDLARSTLIDEYERSVGVRPAVKDSVAA